jgi:putative DNA primase/helicase
MNATDVDTLSAEAPLSTAEIREILREQWGAGDDEAPTETPTEPRPRPPVNDMLRSHHARMNPTPDEARMYLRNLTNYQMTDSGNAERMVALYGREFRWVVDAKEWIAWDGRRWAPGSVERVKVIALYTARMLYKAAADLPADDKKRALMKHAEYSESAYGIEQAVKQAKTLPDVQVRRRDLDTNVDVLNVANGTLDLTTFKLRPHTPSDLLTQLVDVPYVPGTPAPHWQDFLQEVFCGKRDLIEYVQRVVGYTLTGSIKEQYFFLLYGIGANGKSTFIEVIVSVLGDYAAKVDQEALLSPDRKQRGDTPELMVLVGKRLAYVNELEDGRLLDEARIKAMTGSQISTGRALYQTKMQEWQNTAKLWFDLNHLPTFKGLDYGIERRPRVIPFDRTFAEHQQDKNMKDKLHGERVGILAWAVEGARAWRDRGQRGLDAPESVSKATGRYVEANNHLPAFVREEYVMSPGSEVSSSDVQRDYAGFCERRGEKPLDYQGKVVPYLRQRGLELKRRQWKGIKHRPETWNDVGLDNPETEALFARKLA